jgi:hypothetical protein
MNQVDDVLEFAAKYADYWDEFLTSDTFGPEVSDEEKKALETAQEHLSAAICALLHLCGEKCVEKLARDGFVPVKFRPKKTAENRYVRLEPPQALVEKMYRIQFSLETDAATETVQLFTTVVPKKAGLDEAKRKLSAAGTAFTLADDGYSLFAPGMPLVKGKPFAELAEAAARAAVLLFDAVK